MLGTLLTIPLAKILGRRTMYAIYFACSAAALLATFGLDLPSETRLCMYFFIGLTVFGVFGSFTFYLPELLPTRLRSTGSGFCYNIGRVVTAGGVFAVGAIAADRERRPRSHHAHAVHDRLRANHRPRVAALGRRDPRSEMPDDTPY